ncbi:MAG: hypothetical protein IPJ74_24945 [Saprospiraceae bacterium]|nr:hypothetical protein [Saprospiraceae bacterium]
MNSSILIPNRFEIANFDKEQKREAYFGLHGCSKNKGLAGLGTTIILSKSCMIIHLPDSSDYEILYSF